MRVSGHPHWNGMADDFIALSCTLEDQDEEGQMQEPLDQQEQVGVANAAWPGGGVAAQSAEPRTAVQPVLEPRLLRQAAAQASGDAEAGSRFPAVSVPVPQLQEPVQQQVQPRQPAEDEEHLAGPAAVPLLLGSKRIEEAEAEQGMPAADEPAAGPLAKKQQQQQQPNATQPCSDGRPASPASGEGAAEPAVAQEPPAAVSGKGLAATPTTEGLAAAPVPTPDVPAGASAVRLQAEEPASQEGSLLQPGTTVHAEEAATAAPAQPAGTVTKEAGTMQEAASLQLLVFEDMGSAAPPPQQQQQQLHAIDQASPAAPKGEVAAGSSKPGAAADRPAAHSSGKKEGVRNKAAAGKGSLAAGKKVSLRRRSRSGERGWEHGSRGGAQSRSPRSADRPGSCGSKRQPSGRAGGPPPWERGWRERNPDGYSKFSPGQRSRGQQERARERVHGRLHEPFGQRPQERAPLEKQLREAETGGWHEMKAMALHWHFNAPQQQREEQRQPRYAVRDPRRCPASCSAEQFDRRGPGPGEFGRPAALLPYDSTIGSGQSKGHPGGPAGQYIPASPQPQAAQPSHVYVTADVPLLGIGSPGFGSKMEPPAAASIQAAPQPVYRHYSGEAPLFGQHMAAAVPLSQELGAPFMLAALQQSFQQQLFQQQLMQPPMDLYNARFTVPAEPAGPPGFDSSAAFLPSGGGGGGYSTPVVPMRDIGSGGHGQLQPNAAGDSFPPEGPPRGPQYGGPREQPSFEQQYPPPPGYEQQQAPLMQMGGGNMYLGKPGPGHYQDESRPECRYGGQDGWRQSRYADQWEGPPPGYTCPWERRGFDDAPPHDQRGAKRLPPLSRDGRQFGELPPDEHPPSFAFAGHAQPYEPHERRFGDPGGPQSHREEVAAYDGSMGGGRAPPPGYAASLAAPPPMQLGRRGFQQQGLPGDSRAPAAAPPAAATAVASEQQQIWFYADPKGEVQGPHSISQFRKWLDSLARRTDLRDDYVAFHGVAVFKQGGVQVPLSALLG